jgi:hypothetical protein
MSSTTKLAIQYLAVESRLSSGCFCRQQALIAGFRTASTKITVGKLAASLFASTILIPCPSTPYDGASRLASRQKSIEYEL